MKAPVCRQPKGHSDTGLEVRAEGKVLSFQDLERHVGIKVPSADQPWLSVGRTGRRSQDRSHQTVRLSWGR